MHSDSKIEREFTIIGYTGFIGSHLSNVLNISHRYNSKNIGDIVNSSHDVVICCAPSASKWLVNKNPNTDLTNIGELLEVLSNVSCKKFILISSIDVYENLEGTNEDSSIDPSKNHSYGRNRFRMETGCREIFGKKLSIMRLPGLYGFGLKKNIIFDYINNRLEKIDINSSFQWYNVEHLSNDINYVLDKGIPLINLFTEPVPNKELLELFKKFGKIEDISVIDEGDKSSVKYNCRTKYTNSGFWMEKDTVLSDLSSYLNIMLNGSNICVSNLCWTGEINSSILSKYNVERIEVSPFKHFGEGFINMDIDYFDSFKKDNIYSFQSIFYGNKFTIVEDYNTVLQYFKKIIDIADRMSVKIIVFGAPGVRRIRSESDIDIIFKFFKDVSEYLVGKEVVICIEPNASEYGCNFLVNSEEVSSFVRRIDSENIKMMLDTGCMYLEEENIIDSIVKNSDILRHFHFSSPGLGNIFQFSDRIKFKSIIDKLNEIGYAGNITLECLNIPESEIDKSLYEIFRKKNFLVIGAGWYGCHISKKLIESGCIVSMVDKNGIFSGSSSYNQNRLHLGFHYPRSYNTRYLCKDNFERFNCEYGEFTDDVENNLYLVSCDSTIDFKSYKQIMQSSGLEFSDFDLSKIEILNIEGAIICNEKFIDHRRIKNYFSNILNRYSIISKVDDPFSLSDSFDFIIDVTNNSFDISKMNNAKGFYENTLSLIYKKLEGPVIAYTVMDGEFFSIYPYDLEMRYYTLTDVGLTPFKRGVSQEDIEFTPTKKWIECKIIEFEENVKKYLPNFKSDYEYVDYFISRKNKFNFKSDSREMVSTVKGNVISFTCGKITGIFECEDTLTKMKII